MPKGVRTHAGNPPRPDHEKWDKSLTWLGLSHKIKLDSEILRRRAAGETNDVHGNRINLNRSAIIRDLIDANLTIPERLALGQED